MSDPNTTPSPSYAAQAMKSVGLSSADIPTKPSERSEAHQEFIDNLDDAMGRAEKPPMSERVPCTECDNMIWAGETTGKCQRCDAKSDNWKHRSVGMTCSSCMWFVPKVPEDESEARIGRCRKHAPTLNGWPAMKLTDWCGDHKLDEEKMT